MGVVSDEYEDMPEEVREALREGNFHPFKEHSRWDYAQVFVRQNADTAPRSLTRRDVQDDLHQETTIDPKKSTAYNALGDLVDAGVLTCDDELEPHRYYLSYSLESSSPTTTEESMADTGPVAGSDSIDAVSPKTDRSASSTRFSFALKRVWLGTLVVGLGLTLVTLVLLRLSVPTTVSLGSAALAGGALSVALILSIVFTVRFGHKKLVRL
jgi:hypothetical protein